MKRISIGFLITTLVVFTVCASGEERHMPSFTVDVQGHGKPVILIPGLACSAEVWKETAAHLNAEGYQTHALTLAGFGGTKPIAADHRYLATIRDDLATYIGQNQLDHPVIIGHSLGGFLALWVAAADPSLPGKVISVDGLPYLPAVMNPAITPEGAENMAAGMRQQIAGSPAAQYEQTERQIIASMVTSPANIERELKVSLSSDRETVAEAMSELMTTDLRNDMSKIRVPVLVLGSWIAYKDYGATHDSSLALYSKEFEKLPGVRIVMNDTTKHFIQLDAPEWFYAQVDQFIGNAEDTGGKR